MRREVWFFSREMEVGGTSWPLERARVSRKSPGTRKLFMNPSLANREMMSKKKGFCVL